MDYEYDELNRLRCETGYVESGGSSGYQPAEDNLRGECAYEVDVFHKRTTAVESVLNSTGVENTRFDWDHDALGRLVEERFD